MHTLYRDQQVTAHELLQSAATAGGFGGGTDPWAGTFPLNPNGRLPTVRSLGRKLTGQVDRWRSDVVLRSVADEHGHARRYWVQIHNPDP